MFTEIRLEQLARQEKTILGVLKALPIHELREYMNFLMAYLRNVKMGIDDPASISELDKYEASFQRLFNTHKFMLTFGDVVACFIYTAETGKINEIHNDFELIRQCILHTEHALFRPIILN